MACSYWKPVYSTLEEFEIWLLDVRHVRDVPGRRADAGDADWICKRGAHGLVRASLRRLLRSARCRPDIAKVVAGHQAGHAVGSSSPRKC